MKNSIKLILIAVISSFMFFSCGKTASESPSAVVKNYHEAFKSGDYAKALSYTNKTDEEIKQEVEKMKSFKIELKDYSIISEKISEDGKTATVKVKTTMVNPFTSQPEETEEDIELTKVDNKWVIVSDDANTEIDLGGEMEMETDSVAVPETVTE